MSPVELTSPASGLADRTEMLVIRKLDHNDVVGAIEQGWRDFKAAPAIGLALGAFYAAGGWLLGLLISYWGFYFLAYPLATGFALVAPFAAALVYEVSRRLENGEPVSAGAVVRSVVRAGGRDLGWMALVLIFALIVWVDLAAFIYVAVFGLHLSSVDELLQTMLATPSGLLFLVLGNLLGAALALTIFTLTVISCPLLLDRDVDFVTAMVTSVAAFRANPGQMLAWAAMVALWLAVGVVTLLLGLVVILPVLGHATWHLYRRTIAVAA